MTIRQLRTIDVTEAARQLSEQGEQRDRPLLVDVREVNEYSVLRVPGSVLVPMSGLAERFAELPTGRPLLMMCAAGRRSLVAAEFLSRNGYDKVLNVAGGIDAWQRAGLPIRDDLPGPDEGPLDGA